MSRNSAGRHVCLRGPAYPRWFGQLLCPWFDGVAVHGRGLLEENRVFAGIVGEYIFRWLYRLREPSLLELFDIHVYCLLVWRMPVNQSLGR